MWFWKVEEGNKPSCVKAAGAHFDIQDDGRIFIASAAAADTTVTGRVGTFLNTAPTFLLDVPDGTTAFPMLFAGCQTGTVAGGDIGFIVEIDNADRYTSGGTAATVLNAHTGHSRTNLCTFYSATGSAIVATNAYGVRDMWLTLAPDVSPAEAAIQEPLWTPTMGPRALTGPGAWILYTHAATAGPSWGWTFTCGEMPSNQFDTA